MCGSHSGADKVIVLHMVVGGLEEFAASFFRVTAIHSSPIA
jgi:hypothetical protein